MVKGCAAIKGCIAYIGVSYLKEVQADGLGTAALANKSGQFVLASTLDDQRRAGDLLQHDPGDRDPVADQRHALATRSSTTSTRS